jgi:beta-apo-4'-carotenal oxygenase
MPTMPFGGVGSSGEGSYRGKASFDVFTHRRSIAQTPKWAEFALAIRYPPFTGTNKQQQWAKMNDLKPNFDREGRATGWVAWAMGLFGKKSIAVLVGK